MWQNKYHQIFRSRNKTTLVSHTEHMVGGGLWPTVLMHLGNVAKYQILTVTSAEVDMLRYAIPTELFS